MRVLPLIAGTLLGTALLLTTTDASAGDKKTGYTFTPASDGKTASVAVIMTAELSGREFPVRSVANAGPKWTCAFQAFTGGADTSWGVQPVPDPEIGKEYLFGCRAGSVETVPWHLVTYDPANPEAMLGAAAAPGLVLRQAFEAMTAGDPPNLVMAPPKQERQLVGVETWFWIESWAPKLAADESLAGFNARIVITPTSLDIDPGDGSTRISCTPRSAVPWRPGLDDTTCGHTYHRRSSDPHSPGAVDGRYPVRATLTYTVHYQVTDPAGAVIDQGEVDPIVSAASVDPLDVYGVQAIIR